MLPRLSKNNVARALTILVVAGFFITGLFDILDYVIVKIILFGSTAVLLIGFLYILFMEETKKRPED
ncbi:hypothetical protein [Winogradskyella sp. A3E31]|uniref:hypothetical protein n=1 Tax=Winogradskyella sp. A3E31 TaxID=3349637 RepID=UPI00398A932B